jgi:hypothetical protein
MFDGADPEPRLFFVGAEAWPSFVERIQPYLARIAAGSDGHYTAADVQAAIMAGHFLLWLALDGPEIACLMLTQIVSYPQARAMRCVALVGRQPKRWLHLLEQIEFHAKTHFGCSLMEAQHPPKYAHLLRTGGWHTTHVISQKAL